MLGKNRTRKKYTRNIMRAQRIKAGDVEIALLVHAYIPITKLFNYAFFAT